MKKVAFVLVILCLNFMHAISQVNPEYTLSPSLEDNVKSMDELVLIGHDQSGIYILKKIVKPLDLGGTITISATIEGYSAGTLKKIFSTPIEVPVKEGDPFIIRNVKLAHNKIRAFYSYYSKKEALRRVSVLELDLAGKVITKNKEIMTVPAKSDFYTSDATVIADTLGEKYVLFSSRPDDAKGIGWRITQLDSGLKQVYIKDLMISEYKDYQYLGCKLDGNGNIYFVALMYGKGPLGTDPGLVISSYNRANDKLTHYPIFKFDKKQRYYIHDNILFIENKKNVCFINYVAQGFQIARMNKSDASLDKAVFVPHKTAPVNPHGKKSKEKIIEFPHSELFSAELNDNGNLYVCTQYNWETGKGNWLSEITFSESLEISSQRYILQDALNQGKYKGAFILHKKNSSTLFYNDELPDEGRGIRSGAYLNLAIATLSDANDGLSEPQKVTLKSPEKSREMKIDTRQGMKLKDESGFITFVYFDSGNHLLKIQMKD